MRDSMTTSWRRLSDPFRGDVGATEGECGQPERSTEPMRVLIVDIDIKSSHALEILLHASGCSQTRVAYSGHAAIAIAEDFQPSLVLIELNLLDMSGYQLARSLRSKVHSPLRLIAMTTTREHAGRELARVQGFEQYLSKPIVELGFLSANPPPL
jgi:DNA-binding response OmpR family regulator